MGLYDRFVLPRLIDSGCGSKPVMKQRAKVVPFAEGRVLEVGMGSGLNLDFYDPAKITEVIGLEPAAPMRQRAVARMAAREEPLGFPVSFVDLPGEEIPLEDASVDTVVLTYTLCTIPDALGALGQMRRVLKPGGRMLFCEHGLAPDEAVQRWQHRIGPVWKMIGGGCHLNRPIPDLIRQGGFELLALETMYLPNTPRFAGFNYWGAAQGA